MKVTQEKLPASQIQLEIEVPAELSGKVYESTLKQLAQQVRIPGFRKGKVPRKVLVQQVGPGHIKAKALEEILDKAVKQATEAEKIPVLGNYSFPDSFEALLDRYTPGDPFTFKLTADVFPELTLNQYTDLTIKAVENPYDPAIVDRVIENQRKQMSTLVPVEDRAAAMGDVAVVDFSGRFQEPEEDEDPEIPNASATNMQVDLSEGQMIPGFVEGIVGMQPGETKEVEATFPEGYADPSLAGRKACFTITLYELKSRELPVLDDEFAQNLQYESLQDLRDKLEERFKAEAEATAESNRNQAIIVALGQQLEAEFPRTLIEEEAKRLLNQMLSELKQNGQDLSGVLNAETLKHLIKGMEPQAIESLKQTLAVQEVARLESLKVPSEEVDFELATLLQTVKDTKKINVANLRDMLQLEIQQRKVLEWCAEHNAIEWISAEEAEAEKAQVEADKIAAAMASMKELTPDLEDYQAASDLADDEA
ncbi:MAG: trigger factor, partial [Prochlorothrix sp.]